MAADGHTRLYHVAAASEGRQKETRILLAFLLCARTPIISGAIAFINTVKTTTILEEVSVKNLSNVVFVVIFLLNIFL